MCSRPQEIDGHTFSCRTCDECLAVRRHGWVARAMAEKTLAKHTYVVHLTYSDASQETRDAASMFNYSHVSDWLKRVRDAANRHQPGSRVRFICAGEQGSRNGRCHWHVIIYSDVDLMRLGRFSIRKVAFDSWDGIVSRGKQKRRIDWSLWPHGFALFQEPDQFGMHYVLKYCLKDQFTHERSRGTMREGKGEDFATGLFRMSKYPPIGHGYLMRKLEALDESGQMLPHLRLKVPGLRGYWHPNGRLREMLINGLVSLNIRARWRTGRDAPQWAALLATLSEKDMKIVTGPEKPSPQDDPTSADYESDDARLARGQREFVGHRQRTQIARTCGGELPCRDCLHYISSDELREIGVKRNSPPDFGPWFYTRQPGFDPVKQRQARRNPSGGINPFCRGASLKQHQFTFPQSAGKSHRFGPRR